MNYLFSKTTSPLASTQSIIINIIIYNKNQFFFLYINVFYSGGIHIRDLIRCEFEREYNKIEI